MIKIREEIDDISEGRVAMEQRYEGAARFFNTPKQQRHPHTGAVLLLRRPLPASQMYFYIQVNVKI